jgi:hypothetical protein
LQVQFSQVQAPSAVHSPVHSQGSQVQFSQAQAASVATTSVATVSVAAFFAFLLPQATIMAAIAATTHTSMIFFMV